MGGFLTARLLTKIPLFAVLLFSSVCSGSPQSTLLAQHLRLDVAGGRSADDVAHFLAGLPGRPESPYSTFEQLKEWESHRKTMERAWAIVAGSRLPRMESFQRSELRIPQLNGRPVFYPFSGPDALNILTLFPSQPVYVMAALEPVGTLPTPERIRELNLEEYLAGIRGLLLELLQISFFSTKNLQQYLRRPHADGILAPIMVILARSNRRIWHLRYVCIGPDGRITECDPREPSGRPKGVLGAEITFSTESRNATPQRLYYFCVSLADDNLLFDKTFLKYLDGLGPVATLLKAASYLPHYPRYSLITRRILNQSTVILQDDSGIPYRRLMDGSWKVQLYGRYNRPIELFRDRSQPDLQEAYATSKVRPLPFSIGYGFGRMPSNLLLAVRVR